MKQDFENILNENADILHKMCRVYTFNEEEYEELFQEMSIQVWTSLGNFRGDAKISTWIYKICINTALSFRSKIHKFKKKHEPIDGKILIQPEKDSTQDDLLQKLYAAIRELKPIDRAIVGMYLDENSYEEIAGVLGISKTNVATRLMRLKQRLIKELE